MPRRQPFPVPARQAAAMSASRSRRGDGRHGTGRGYRGLRAAVKKWQSSQVVWHAFCADGPGAAGVVAAAADHYWSLAVGGMGAGGRRELDDDGFLWPLRPIHSSRAGRRSRHYAWMHACMKWSTAAAVQCGEQAPLFVYSPWANMIKSDLFITSTLSLSHPGESHKAGPRWIYYQPKCL